jgi:hypothetical protein
MQTDKTILNGKMTGSYMGGSGLSHNLFGVSENNDETSVMMAGLQTDSLIRDL